MALYSFLRRTRRVLMVTVLVAAGVMAVGVAESRANIVVQLQSVTPGSGSNWLWSYRVSVDQFQTANPNPIDFTLGSFFTIYDFKGYVANSAAFSGTGTWDFSTQNLGYTPAGANPL